MDLGGLWLWAAAAAAAGGKNTEPKVYKAKPTQPSTIVDQKKTATESKRRKQEWHRRGDKRGRKQ